MYAWFKLAYKIQDIRCVDTNFHRWNNFNRYIKRKNVCWNTLYTFECINIFWWGTNHFTIFIHAIFAAYRSQGTVKSPFAVNTITLFSFLEQNMLCQYYNCGLFTKHSRNNREYFQKQLIINWFNIIIYNPWQILSEFL